MGIYLTPEFEQERLKARINNKILCKAAKSILAGLPGDHLGKYTYKKRLPLPGVGARDGARTIVFFNYGENVYFFDMYLKSRLTKKSGKELEDGEVAAYCMIARDFVALTINEINGLLEKNELIEVNCDD